MLVCLPASLRAVSTTLSWSPSADPNVTGYMLYYGTNSHSYTSSLAATTNGAVVAGLTTGVTYYFAATSDDANGDQSTYSSEATFAAYSIAPQTCLKCKTISPNNTDQVTFSLGAGSPSGATVNPANGVVTWIPDNSYAKSTNTISVTVNDATTSNSVQMSIVVSVSDYLVLGLPSVPAQPGQNVSLPLNISGSDGVSAMDFTITCPAQALQNPSLAFFWPVTGSVTQNGNSLSIHLANAYGYPLPVNPASLNFSVAPGLDSQFIPLPITSFSAVKSSGVNFTTCTTQSGEVAVVGSSPLLRPTTSNGTRNLTLYANPANSYELDSTTSLTPPIQWNVVEEYSPTNLQQSIAADTTTPVIFYRLTPIQ